MIRSSNLVSGKEPYEQEIIALEKILSDYKNKNYNKENAPLLKLGGGSGFLATTIGLKIKDNNDFLYSKIIEYKDAYEFCFPKSRKITRLNERPLGWIQLNFKDNICCAQGNRQREKAPDPQKKPRRKKYLPH